MSEEHPETSLVAADGDPADAPTPAEPEPESGLTEEIEDEELRGWPDEPTTS